MYSVELKKLVDKMHLENLTPDIDISNRPSKIPEEMLEESF